MGLFRDLGERVERFKQQAADASEESAEYECRACGSPVYTERAECPECGRETVVRRAGRAAEDDAEPGSSAETDESAGRGGPGETDDGADAEPSPAVETDEDGESANHGAEGDEDDR